MISWGGEFQLYLTSHFCPGVGNLTAVFGKMSKSRPMPRLPPPRRLAIDRCIRLTILKKKRWNVSTPRLCDKMCVRKLQYCTWTHLNRFEWEHHTFEHTALAISRFTEYRLFAPFWLLPGRPWSAGYWQAALGRQNSSCVCLCLNTCGHLRDNRLQSKSQRPALTKIMLSLCYGLSWQMATSKVTFYGVSALKYAKDTRCSSWIPTKVWTRDDRKNDILFWDKYQFNLICQICCKILLQG